MCSLAGLRRQRTQARSGQELRWWWGTRGQLGTCGTCPLPAHCTCPQGTPSASWSLPRTRGLRGMRRSWTHRCRCYTAQPGTVCMPRPPASCVLQVGTAGAAPCVLGTGTPRGKGSRRAAALRCRRCPLGTGFAARCRRDSSVPASTVCIACSLRARTTPGRTLAAAACCCRSCCRRGT